MRRPTRFERGLRDLHGPDIIDMTAVHPTRADARFIRRQPKTTPWEIQLFAVLMTPVLLLLIAAGVVALIATLYFLWIVVTAPIPH